MTAAYKKRAKAGWNGGKAYKSESNRSERIYEAEDIAEQEREVEKSSKAKQRPSGEVREIKRLLSDVKFAIKLSGGDIETINVHDDSWSGSIRQEYYQKYKKAIPALEKHLEQTEMDNKLRRNIEEVLRGCK